MSDSSFGDPSEFELSEYFKLGDWLEEDSSPAPVDSRPTQNPVNHPYAVYEAGGSSSHREGPNTRVNGDGQDNRDVREKVAFKIKTDTDILDDGFKWRKYGKKMVKNSPNPRNYFRCSVEGCPVKKRVERDREDPGYVIATYEGTHNHESPNKF